MSSLVQVMMDEEPAPDEMFMITYLGKLRRGKVTKF